MTLEVEVYWSFRSPYSYLATPKLVALRAEYDLHFAIRPVYPLVVREPGVFLRLNPLFLPYLLRDAHRVAEINAIPFGLPRPDPVAMDYQSMTARPDQPHIHRLTRIAVAAAQIGDGLALIDQVGSIIWSGAIDGWDKGAHLAEAVGRAGFDLEALDAMVAADPEGYDAMVAANQAALAKAGHWGVPTCVFAGEPFFGQDRIDALVWRLRQNGLRPKG